MIAPDEVGRFFARVDDPEDQRWPGLSLAVVPGSQPLRIQKANYFSAPAFVRKFDPHPDFKPPLTLDELHEKLEREKADTERLREETRRQKAELQDRKSASILSPSDYMETILSDPSVLEGIENWLRKPVFEGTQLQKDWSDEHMARRIIELCMGQVKEHPHSIASRMRPKELFGYYLESFFTLEELTTTRPASDNTKRLFDEYARQRELWLRQTNTSESAPTLATVENTIKQKQKSVDQWWFWAVIGIGSILTKLFIG